MYLQWNPSKGDTIVAQTFIENCPLCRDVHLEVPAVLPMICLSLRIALDLSIHLFIYLLISLFLLNDYLFIFPDLNFTIQ